MPYCTSFLVLWPISDSKGQLDLNTRSFIILTILYANIFITLLKNKLQENKKNTNKKMTSLIFIYISNPSIIYIVYITYIRICLRFRIKTINMPRVA